MKEQIKHFRFNIGLKYIAGLILALMFVACEEETHGPIYDEGTAPGQVTNIKTIPTPGGADLIYNLPDDTNLSYIEAVVNTPEGKTFKYNASSHRDTISVIGLGSTDPQEVLLYSVSKNEKRSEPVSVTINPLTPPYLEVFKTLTISEGLGGVNLNYQNDNNAELAFYLGRIVDGEFIEEDAFYYNKVRDRGKDRYLFWGYPAEKQKFGIFIRDRWDHYSDTLYGDVTPILEVLLDRSKFKKVSIQEDSEYINDAYQKPENLWDGNWSPSYDDPYTGGNTDWRHGDLKEDKYTKNPAALTIDLGMKANISRIIVNHYWQYTGDAPKEYEIYGLEGVYDDNLPYSIGAWHNWTLLAKGEQVKPSATGGSADEDKANWEAGDVIMVSPPSEIIRYIRIKAIESWNGRKNWDAAEIRIYGAPVE
jgi:hypothetical protein